MIHAIRSLNRPSFSGAFARLFWSLLVGAWAVPVMGQEVYINEVMISNSTTIADENGDFEDWVELYNAGATAVSLLNWGLSDTYAQPFQWTFPDIVIQPGEHLLVWASGKDRKSGPELHTNFRIDASGEELTLYDAGGILRDEVEPIEIPTHISYGRRLDDPNTWVFFAVPTPGSQNAGPSGHLLPETVVFSETSRTFTGNVIVALSGAASDQVIRYTMTSGAVPTASSPLYTSPLTLSTTRVLRARVFDSTGASGPVTSHHFLRLDSSVANRQSNLPMVVLNCRTIDPANLTKEVVPRDGFFHLFDRDTDGISALGRQPDLSSRQGLRVRGSTSQWNPKRPYSVEFWNEANDDLFRELLGMAPDSDWVFYAPYDYDRAYIRNSVAYELSREIGRWASETRFVEVYVNRDGSSLTSSDYMGVYAIVERIKQGDHRLGHDNVNRRDVPPDPVDLAAPGPWTGGYIFKMDRNSADEYIWHTNRNIPTVNVSLVLSRPKMTNLDGGPYTERPVARASSRQLNYIVDYIQAFEDALYTDQSQGFTNRSYLNYIDRASWVDHLLVNAFTKNVDALRLSAFFHKPENGPIVAGPVWDFDRSMDSYDDRDDAFDSWSEPFATDYFTNDWWGVIAQDPDFIQAFYDRWAELRPTTFSATALTDMVQSMGDEIHNSAHGLGSAADRDASRWSGNTPRPGGYLAEIEHIRNWLVNRAGWMDRRRIDGGLLPAPPQIQHNAGTVTITGSASIYFTINDTDPRASGGAPGGQLYTGPIQINGPTVVTARVRSGGGHWSTPATASFTLAPSDSDETTLHYWSFNAETLAPFYTLANASLNVSPGPTTEVTYDTGADFSGINNRLGENTGAHLRINNPLGATVRLSLPTTGYEDIVLRYESRRSGQGAGLQQLSYTIDGDTFTDWPNTVTVHNDAPQLYAFNFAQTPGAADNPDFAVRITFAQGAGGLAGNNRFDNIALEGAPLPGTNLPPQVVFVPNLVKLIAGAAPVSGNLSQLFQDPDGDPLTFNATSAGAGVLTADVTGDMLALHGAGQGDAIVTVEADDGFNPPVSLSFRVLVYPAAHPLAATNFFFGHWASNEPAGSFPPHMLFLQSDMDDPDLDEPLLFAYRIPPEDAASPSDADFPYAATSRTRIAGHGASGISFINTGRGRDLGAALLALNTTQATDIDVTWTAETLLPNSRIYGIRLQSRLGIEADWADVLHLGEPVEYIRDEESGETVIGPIRLPETLEDRPYVQLRWKYRHISVATGPRAQLRLDNIAVSATKFDTYAHWLARVFPDPADRNNPAIASPGADPWGEGVTNLLRYALDIDPNAPGRSLLPQAETEEGRLSLQFHRDPAKTDIAYVVEASFDLVDWTEILYDSSEDQQPNTDGETMRILDSLPLPEIDGKRFLRLRIGGM